MAKSILGTLSAALGVDLSKIMSRHSRTPRYQGQTSSQKFAAVTKAEEKRKRRQERNKALSSKQVETK